MLTAFLLMCGYSLVKPVRDEVAAAHSDSISLLWTGTFLVTLLAMPLFGFIASRSDRGRLLTLTFRSFLAAFLVFAAVFHLQASGEGERAFAVDGAFYIFVSVYNLFTLSLFWSVMADLFRSGQGKELFARITIGATLGAVAGPALTTSMVGWLGPSPLLLVSAGLLEVGLRFLRTMAREADPDHATQPRLGGRAWEGLRLVLRSPQLRGICGYLLLMLVVSGFIYRIKAELASEIPTRADRTSFYANIELIANGITLAMQALASGWLMQRRGVGWTLMLLPAFAVLAFGMLGFWMSLTSIALVDIMRRCGQYALAKPAREVLFTVLPRQEKYQAKSFVDTFVYRGGDVAVSGLYDLLAGLGLGLQALSLAVVPSSLLWMVTAGRLGCRHRSLERQESTP